jgi:hypothetical protein
VGTPQEANDAVTKAYVDNMMYGGSPSGPGLNEAFQKIDAHTEGIAVAMSMGGLTLPTNKKLAIATNVGFYQDKQAVSAQGAYRLSDSWALSGGVGFGVNEGEIGGRVGIMAAW